MNARGFYCGQHQPDLYQAGCCKSSSGKKVSITKFRVSWIYGHVHKLALADSSSDNDDQTTEHDISLVWSITSGKKLIVHDSEEVHSSMGRGKFQFSWSNSRHVFTLIAYATPFLRKAKNNRKQFELLIDGCNFDDLPRMSELGLRGGSTGTASLNQRMPASNTPRNRFRNAFANDSYEVRTDVNTNRCVDDDIRTRTRSDHTMETRKHMNTFPGTTFMLDSVTNNAWAAIEPPQHYIPDDSGRDGPQDFMSFDDTVSTFTPEYQQDTGSFKHQQIDEFNSIKSPSDSIWDWDSIIEADPQDETSMPNHHTNSPTTVTALDAAVHQLVNLDDLSQPVFKEYSPGAEITTSLSELKKSEKAPSKVIMQTYHSVYAQPNSGAVILYGQPRQSYEPQASTE